MNAQLLDKIISLFNEQTTHLRLLDISKSLQIKSDSKDYDTLIEHIDLLVEQQVLTKGSRHRYYLNKQSNNDSLIGIFNIDGKKNIVNTTSNVYPLVYIAQNRTLGALNGDKVSVRILSNNQKHKYKGEVLEIIEHSQTEISGRISYSEGAHYLIADNPLIETDFRIPTDCLQGARDGDKVICKVVN